MRYLVLLSLLSCISACAGPITAWKGRAYGEHTIEPGELITMSSTFRNARTADKIYGAQNVNHTLICFEPHSEVAALMAGTTSAGYSGATLSDATTANLLKGHESSGPVQLASLYQSISCNAFIDDLITFEQYQARTNALLDGLLTVLTTPPPPAAKAKEERKDAP